MTLQVGDRYRGFVVRRASPIRLMSSLFLDIEHEESGLRLIHVSNDDTENLFSILFTTPPPDDTGMPHILEHSVLGGSRKFPSREGIFELSKRSVGSYINAMTGTEYTIYPVASTVKKDLFNLAEVYWDAVFSPLLTEHVFQREAHRITLANGDDPASNLVIKGIVHSEMQGAYSNPESLIWERFNRTLLPDTAFAFDAGGVPDVIPQLTLAQLREFHASHYRPDRAIVGLWGRIATTEYLDFIAERLEPELERKPPLVLRRQPRFEAPRRATINVPVAPSDAGRGWLVLGWAVGSGTDTRAATELMLLHQILFGHAGALLRKPLLDAKFGDDLALTEFSESCLESRFVLGVRGANLARADEFERFVFEQLGLIAERGIERDAIATACQQLAYATLEIGNAFPVWLIWRLCAQLLDNGDPIGVCERSSVLSEVKHWAMADPSRLSALIRRYLLGNPHRVLMIAEGDPALARQLDDTRRVQLAERKRSMSPAELEQLEAAAAEYERVANEKDTRGFDQLPRLGLRDLPVEPRRIATQIERQPRLDFLTNDLYTNGINYLHLDIDLSHVPVDLLPYASIWVRCLGKLGTRGRRWAETAAEMAAATSGIGGYVQLDAHALDPDRMIRTLHLSTSFLDNGAARALELLDDLLCGLDFGDRQRLAEILTQVRAEQRTDISYHAMQLAHCHGASPFSPEAWLTDECHGLPLFRLVEQLAAGFERNDSSSIALAIDRLSQVQAAFFTTNRISASFSGNSIDRDVVRERLGNFCARSSAQAVSPIEWKGRKSTRRVGLAGPMDVAFCTCHLPGPHYSAASSAALEIGTHYLQEEHIVDAIRLRGNAYGAWCTPDLFHRNFVVGSYRDPDPARTVHVLRDAARAAAALDWSSEQIERAILGTARRNLVPNRPAETTAKALWWHTHGLTDEVRLNDYSRLLAVTPSEAREALLSVLHQNHADASVCVIAGRHLLDVANAGLADQALTIEELF